MLIEALPAPLREAIVLRELHELGYREIAEVTGVPIGTVMSRLHRARSALRRAWEGKDAVMQCEEVRPRLEAYIDGELAEAERVLLRDHLAGCAELRPGGGGARAPARRYPAIRPDLSRARGVALADPLRAPPGGRRYRSRGEACARRAGSPMPPRSCSLSRSAPAAHS